jgi:hypothetical protein
MHDKYSLMDISFWSETENNSSFLDWKIFANSGPLDLWARKEQVIGLITERGFKYEIKNSVIIAEHPQFYSPVEILFKGGITANGMQYNLCFQSASLRYRKEDAVNQEELYKLIVSILPIKWRVEVFVNKNGKYELYYSKGQKFGLKKRRKI